MISGAGLGKCPYDVRNYKGIFLSRKLNFLSSFPELSIIEHSQSLQGNLYRREGLSWFHLALSLSFPNDEH
jgi:hypothetical protein